MSLTLLRSLALALPLLAPAALAQGPGSGSTPITSLPFVIQQPGAYHLVSDLTGVANKAGIRVTASHVDIDLGGFTLRGVPGSLAGIEVGVLGQSGLTVRRGTLLGWGREGANLAYMRSTRVEGVFAKANGEAGLFVGVGSAVVGCRSEDNKGHGFHVLEDSLIDGCIAARNNGAGIATFQRVHVDDCVASENGEGGIDASSECSIESSIAAANTGIGIRVAGNSQVVGCLSARNSSHGITVVFGATVRDCTVRFSGGATDPSVAGIRAEASFNCIEDNEVARNGIGIALAGSSNVVLRNTAISNLTPFVDGGSANMVGPFVTFATLATNTNPAANYVR